MRSGFKTILVFFTAIVLPFKGHSQEVENGLLDARFIDFSDQRIPIKGSWAWYDDQLLSPREINAATPAFVQFPKPWAEFRSNQSGLGYVTYAVNILLPDSMPKIGLDIPDTYSSYRLWVNGKVMAENGVVGKSKDETRPMWFAQTITFDRPGDTLKLVWQVANFHHANGGVSKNIYLGTANYLLKNRRLADASAVTEFCALILMSIIFLVLYFQQGRKKIIIYFSLMCLSWGIRTMFSNDYVMLRAFPNFNWTLAVRIEYMTLYFPMIWSILFLSRLFVNERNQIVKYLLVTLNWAYVVFTLFAPTHVFTQWINIVLLTVGVLLLHCTVVIIRAFINERVGSSLVTLSILLMVLLFAYDVFTYEGLFVYNPFVLSVGYIAIYLLMGIALLLSLNIIKSNPKSTTLLRYDDLYKDDSGDIK